MLTVLDYRFQVRSIIILLVHYSHLTIATSNGLRLPLVMITLVMITLSLILAVYVDIIAM